MKDEKLSKVNICVGIVHIHGDQNFKCNLKDQGIAVKPEKIFHKTKRLNTYL